MNPVQEILIQIEANDLWQESITLARNEFLTQEGKINTNLYFVEEGSLRIFLMDEGEEQTIRFGYQNSIFGALDSFFSNEPTKYSIQALKKTKIKVVAKDVFMELIHENQENRNHWQFIMEQIILQQLEREVDLLTTSPKDRYLRILKRSPLLFQEIPHKYIASYLRMSPETLSRIKKS